MGHTDEKLQKIVSFIGEHHVFSLATCKDAEVSACSVFYVYDKEKNCFVFASTQETLHVEQMLFNPFVAGNILVETEVVKEIRGLQFKGRVEKLSDKELQKSYFQRFTHALSCAPQLWVLQVSSFKLTDNSISFGHKITWP